MIDLAIRSTRTFTPEGLRPALVLVKDGLIQDVLPIDAQPDRPVVEGGDSVLMPGLIDPHVHINEPGRTDWEGFNTATKAAIAGGLTTLVDMPLNSSPVTTSVANFHLKLDAAQGKIHADCGFWGGIVPGNAGEIEGLIAAGVLGFKAFLTHSGIDEFPNATEADLRQAMPILARHGLPLLVHCELSEGTEEWKKGDRHSYQNYLASRPKRWEDEAIGLMIRLCRETGCRTHIVHLSSSNSIESIANAKAEGLPLTVETGQHYLFFDAEDIGDGHTEFKCAPPIRERANNDLLWQALQEGIIDFVATDHSPAPPGLKQMATGDFATAWGGIASLQFALPVLWTAARKRGAYMADMAKWLSENPAKLIGQSHRKGRIEKGFEANLVLWNPEVRFTVTEDIIQHRHKVTPYLGLELHGLVERTFLHGAEVYGGGMFTALNRGRIVTRTS